MTLGSCSSRKIRMLADCAEKMLSRRGKTQVSEKAVFHVYQKSFRSAASRCVCGELA